MNHTLEEWFRRNFLASKQTGPSPENLSIAFDRVTYLGGLPEDTTKYEAKAIIIVDEEGLHKGARLFPWAQMDGVTVDGEEVSRWRSRTTFAFRPLSRFGPGKAKQQAFLSLRRKDGAAAHFQFDKISPQLLREQLTPILTKVGLPFLDKSPSTGQAVDPDMS
jgi:hypothetical protein